MAKLPQALDMAAPNARVGGSATLDFGSLDNALQGVARTIERVDEGRRRADDEVAGRVVQETLDRYNAEATERWSAYDGRTFGQDAVEGAKFDEAFAPLLARDDLTDGERDSVTRQVQAARRQTMTRALATAATVRAQRFAADRDANEASAARRIVQETLVKWAEVRDTILKDWDGSQPLPEAVDAAFTTLTAQMLEPHPPGVGMRARDMLDGQRVQSVMNAVHGQEEARDAETLRNVGSAADLLVNRVRRDPGLLASAKAEAIEIAKSLPASARPKFLAEQDERLAGAHLDGRIAGGDADGALAAIDAGQFDFLPPSALEGARNAAHSQQQAMTEEKAWTQADIRARLQSNLEAIAQGGEPDLSIIAEARNAFKPEEVVEMVTQQRAARLTQPVMATIRLMTAAQAEELMQDRERRAATDAERATLEVIRKKKDEDFALRASDPAKWVVTPLGPTDSRGRVRDAWLAFQANPTRQTADAYAGQALAVQNDGHIAERNRRLLPRETARTMVAKLEEPGVDTITTMRDMAAFVDAFGGNRARVLVELSQAGMTLRATGALMHYADDPATMARYTAGLAAKTDKADVETIDRELTRGLADYRRTVASDQGMEPTMAAARTVAAGLVAAGERPSQAARLALQPITGDLEFGRTFAVPRSAGIGVAQVQAVANRRITSALMNNLSGVQVVRVPGLTEEQSRRRLRDRIDEGHWVTKPDNSGLVFMIDLNGDRPLTRADGKPFELTWAEAAREAPAAMRSIFVPQ